MLWLVDSAHISTRVNNWFALPKQAPNINRNVFPVYEIWSNVQAEVHCQYDWFSEKKGYFLKRPRARNNIAKEVQKPNKLPCCSEYVYKISAENI